MLNRIGSTFLGTAMVLVGACSPATPASMLEDRVFISQQVLENGEPRALLSGTVLRLEFLPGGEFSASGGCNSGRAMYELVDDALVYEAIAQTAIGCDQERHEQDDWYFFDVLGSRPMLTLDGDALTLDNGVTRVEYLDQEVATPDVELVGTVWQVESLVLGEVVSAMSWPEPATLTFDDDGMVDVFTGCNSGRARYEVAGSDLRFSELLVTEEGCSMQSVELEETVNAVVGSSSPVAWEVSVDRLTLTEGDRGLGLVRVAS